MAEKESKIIFNASQLTGSGGCKIFDDIVKYNKLNCLNVWCPLLWEAYKMKPVTDLAKLEIPYDVLLKFGCKSPTDESTACSVRSFVVQGIEEQGLMRFILNLD